MAEMKIHDGWKYTGWKIVVINTVMLRATRKGGYYIIKYDDDCRCDIINYFRINGKSLKSYLAGIK